MKFILLVLVMFTGCFKHVDQGDNGPNVDTVPNTKGIERAINRFNKEFGVNVDSTFYFDKESWKDLSTSGSGTQAFCFVQANHITIDHRFWVQSELAVQEALVYHELGHCMLGIGHDPFPGIMNGFIGHTVNHYAYWYEESIEYMKSVSCHAGCELERIINNRASYAD